MIKDARIREWFYKNKDHKGNQIAKILDVEYAHLRLDDKSDLYVTREGLPFIENLRPENFLTDEEWFRENAIQLPGSSHLHKVRTKTIRGRYKDVVIKWNRMGQEIPGEDENEELMNAEFNSPFEEFSLVVELRKAMRNSPAKIIIQRPLAIYTPPEHEELWRTGRKEYKMQRKIQSHKEIVLDMYRSYAVIYEWIGGIDAAYACDQGLLDETRMVALTLESEQKIKQEGFRVRDRKPHHVIIRPKKNGDFARDKDGSILSALVDFELLIRTPKEEKTVKKRKRTDYLKRQRDRFTIDIPKKFHPHLHHVNILGVEYVYGHVESTKGRLWVVGKDPFLFDYFLPERWEKSEKTKISVFNNMYYTISKDNIHLAWKFSKVGQKPDMDPFKSEEMKILQYGYNSPFEEVALAVELSNKGIATIYPRAIYMMENKTEVSKNLLDNTRYENHKDYSTPDEIPILEKDRDYVIIWGYWNGPDEKLAEKDGDYYEGIDMLRALREGIITQEKYITLLQVAKVRLLKAGVEDLNLRGNHLLISFDSKGRLIKDEEGVPEMRICNFEFLKKL